ncbi:helix-turn-helix transcriptional regulator [Collinsella ihumii]|uniref:helix-turn-helix transcriptional regulator n=1 Tax=Collinsella ihumii TaxID=1720204 RepID=UPI00082970C9|nr:helix-turn-helix transcriptional regulator [Collinsella ihumii]
MVLGNSLFHARKKAGLIQEEVAERLGVSRQTIGKWEADETLPDIRQSKRLATLYGVTLDELIEFDLDVSQVEEAIERSSEELEEKIDWTSAWAKKYPILAKYQGEVNIPLYARRIRQMLDELKAEHGYSELDAMLALKDILYGVWKQAKAAGEK